MIYKNIDIGSRNSENIHQIAALVKNVGSDDLGLSESCRKWVLDLSEFCFMKQEASALFGQKVAERVMSFDSVVIFGRIDGGNFDEKTSVVTKEWDDENLWKAFVNKLAVWKFDRKKSNWVANKVNFKLEKI